MSRVKKERQYLMAISVMRGIITLIEDDGSIQCYRQRGLNKLTQEEISREVYSGRLAPHWRKLPELPDNYSIHFEDPEIMGRAIATYPLVLEHNRAKRGAKR